MTYHILVVDDEPDFEALISQKFRREIRKGQYLFTFAGNGVEAYQKVIETDDIDVVLTDINMPVMDGLALLKKLNTLEQPPKTVVISAYTDIDRIRVAMNNGAFDFLTKPINFPDLVVTLEKTLKAVAEREATQQQFDRAQLQLVQNEKMAFLGNSIANIAHEINNPIGFLQSNIEPAQKYVEDLISLIDLYQKKMPAPDEEIKLKIEAIDLEFIREDLPKLLESMNVGVDRIRNLSKSLRTFSRKDREHKVLFKLNEGIDSTLMILKHRIKANKHRPAIKIVKNYEEIPEVKCFPGELNQVFMNILANAIDTLDEANEGKTYSEIEANPNRIRIATSVLDEGRVQILISDNGGGMKPETKERIFEHGFTTKAVGKGTGLGMAIAYNIITEKHGGTITCTSEPGRGTEFAISLPLS